MFKRLTGSVLVSAGECAADAPGERRVRYAVLRGRKVTAQGECTLGELRRLGGWDVRASFFSRAGYFERTHAQTASKRLATVVARRFIDGEMLFNEPYRLRLALHPISEHEVSLHMMAASEIDCLRLDDALPMETRPVSLVALEEAAIAALVAKATREAVHVLFARGDRFVSFVADKGEVRQRRVEALLSGGDSEALAGAVQRAEMSLAGGYGGPGDASGNEVTLRVFLGDARPLASVGAPLRDYPSRELEKKMAALVEGGDVLAEPELFGLRYVSGTWNFLEAAQANRARAWQIALPGAMVATGCAAVLILALLLEMVQNAGLSSQVEADRQRLLSERDALLKRVPNDKELARFNELSELLKRRSEQVRADRLLGWISQELPGGITIASMQLFAANEEPPKLRSSRSEGGGQGSDLLARFFAPAAKDKDAPAAKAVPQPGTYTVRLELTLAGGYDLIEEQAAEVIRRLAGKLTFNRAHLDYDATKSRARLVSELTARAEEFH